MTSSADAERALVALERTLDGAPDCIDASAQERVATAALDSLYAVGRAMTAGAIDAAAVRAVVDRTRSRFEGLRKGIFGVVVDAPAALLDEVVYPSAWVPTCAARSSVQFAITLYWAGGVPAWLVDDLDHFDHLLEQVGRRDAPLPPEDVPAGIPHAHWWWWVPYEDRPR